MNKGCGPGSELCCLDWMVAVSHSDTWAFINEKCKLIWQSLKSLSSQIITVTILIVMHTISHYISAHTHVTLKNMPINSTNSIVSVSHLTHTWGMLQQYQGWIDADGSWSPA